MMSEYTIPLFLIVLSSFLVINIIKKRRSDLREQEEMSDDIPLQDVVTMHDFNGHKIYLAESEVAAWKSLSNAQKQKIHLRQMYFIKNGHLVKVTDENGNEGLITRIEGIAKGVIK